MSDATAVLLDGRLAITGALLVLVALAIGPRLARHLHITALHAFAMVIATGAVVAVTLANRTSDQLDIARLIRWQPERWLRVRRADWVLNVVLFIPAAALWTAAVRRPVVVVASGALLSILIEAAQSTFRLGTGDQADLAANVLGAIAGAAIGWVWARSRQHAPPGPAAGWTRQQALGAIVLAVAAAAAGVIGVGAAADQRTDDLIDSLSGSLGGATSEDLSEILRLPEDRALSYFSTPLGVRADAIVRHGAADDRVHIRYPVEFLGARRCVFAEIGPDRTVLREAAGAGCTLPDSGDYCCSASSSQRSSSVCSSACAVASSAPTRARSRWSVVDASCSCSLST
jgi:hypothetical protein